jgi:hypothetical protein
MELKSSYGQCQDYGGEKPFPTDEPMTTWHAYAELVQMRTLVLT